MYVSTYRAFEGRLPADRRAGTGQVFEVHQRISQGDADEYLKQAALICTAMAWLKLGLKVVGLIGVAAVIPEVVQRADLAQEAGLVSVRGVPK